MIDDSKTPARIHVALLIALAGVSAFAGCSASEEAKLPPGRCVSNEQCGEGEACRNTYCEDIYYPEKDIKLN